MEIYEMTYEGILFKIKAEEEKKVGHTFKLQWMKEQHNLNYPEKLMLRWAKKQRYLTTSTTTTHLICLLKIWTVTKRKKR